MPLAHGPETHFAALKYRLQNIHVRQVAVPGIRIVYDHHVSFAEIIFIFLHHRRDDVGQRAGKPGEVAALGQQPSFGIEQAGDEIAGFRENSGSRGHHQGLRHFFRDGIETFRNDRDQYRVDRAFRFVCETAHATLVSLRFAIFSFLIRREPAVGSRWDNRPSVRVSFAAFFQIK